MTYNIKDIIKKIQVIQLVDLKESVDANWVRKKGFYLGG